MQTQLLKETSLYVSDLEIAEAFYVDILGFDLADRAPGHRSTLRHGDSTLTLFQAASTAAPSSDAVPAHGQVSFGIDPAEVASWRAHLQRHQVPIEGDLVWPNGAESITCRDPAGNRVELKTQESSIGDGSAGDRASAISKGLHAEWKIYQAANLGAHHIPTG